MVNYFTEITSNVATASVLLPILASLSHTIGVHPFGLMVGASLAASCAFMLPVATPPNAIAYSSGYLSMNIYGKSRILDEFDDYYYTLLFYLLHHANHLGN
jgi:sodium-dependent dicarboxylate transporter 2/3/5